MPAKHTSSQKSPLSKYTVAHIHHVVRQASNIGAAATKLGVGDVTLASHLSKFILDNELLTFISLKQVTLKRAREIWGSNYEQVMSAPQINIKHYSGAHLHDICRSVKTVREAANLLGVRDHTVNRFLRGFFYNGKPLCFKVFISLSCMTARQVFGDLYDQSMPSQRKDLTPGIFIDEYETLPDLLIIDNNSDTISVSNEPVTNSEQNNFDTLASAFIDPFDSNHQLSQAEKGLIIYGLFSSSPDDEPKPKRPRINSRP